MFGLAVQRVRRFARDHKGERIGQVFFDPARMLPEGCARVRAILGDAA
jgi:hypothetical protein